MGSDGQFRGRPAEPHHGSSPPGRLPPDRKALASVTATYRLLEADEGVNVVFVRPSNDRPFDRSLMQVGMMWAAPSQVAIDCLSGNGRMPAEGEAVIEWMSANETQWRIDIAEMLHLAKRSDD